MTDKVTIDQEIEGKKGREVLFKAAIDLLKEQERRCFFRFLEELKEKDNKK